MCVYFCIAGRAAAQNCPDGIPSGGNPHCIPPDRPESPYYNGSGAYINTLPTQPRVMQGYWADRWGAVAYDEVLGKVGISTSQKSKIISEKAAINNCTKRGGSKCVVKYSYRNQCIAIIAGDNDSSIQGGSNLSIATDLGYKKCKSKDTNCREFYAGCSMPEIEYPTR